MAMTKEEQAQLLESLKAAASKVKQSKGKKKTGGVVQSLGIRNQASAPKKPQVVRVEDQWKDLEVVLLVNRMACQDCGVVHEAPNVYPFLKKSHPTKGLHYEALKPEQYRSRSKLPHSIEYQDGTVPSCQECFKYGLNEDNLRDCYQAAQGNQ